VPYSVARVCVCVCVNDTKNYWTNSLSEISIALWLRINWYS